MGAIIRNDDALGEKGRQRTKELTDLARLAFQTHGDEAEAVLKQTVGSEFGDDEIKRAVSFVKHNEEMKLSH